MKWIVKSGKLMWRVQLGESRPGVSVMRVHRWGRGRPACVGGWGPCMESRGGATWKVMSVVTDVEWECML